ncbi:MAG: 30S ribosomal protein S13 [Acidobacteriota bacterium]|nr:30S ribosomal protein S13 [Acidobacteriota bacterium]
MARIAGVDLPQNKRAEIGLTSIFGIGRSLSNQILGRANVSPDTRIKDLAEDEVRRVRQVIQDGIMVEGDLRRKVTMDISRLQETGSYRGSRHRRSLPCRGQRTHTNARTKKGPRVAIAGKKRTTGKKG